MVQGCVTRLWRLLAVLLVAGFPALAVDGQFAYQPLSIPVRDGQFLAADVYFDGTLGPPRPVILIQTPYNKNLYRWQAVLPPETGGVTFPYDPAYNYVILDWRGFYSSAAAAVPGYDRGLDGYDAVEWIAAQGWCNGRVGTWGHSALGHIQFLTARHRPPHLVCCAPYAKDFLTTYSDYYYGGDYRKEHVESMARLGLADPDLILAHPQDDLFWQVAAAQSDLAAETAVPILLATGWFDHFPDDILAAFEALRARSDPAVRDLHHLFVGPWIHGGMNQAEQGELSFPDAVGVHDALTLRFWDHHLRSLANGWDMEPVVRYYQLGESAWRAADSWTDIAREELVLYLQPGGGLDSATPPADGGADTFIYDPDDPTPALGGSRFAPFDPDVVAGPVDIGLEIETRPDVRVYSTPVLNRPLRLNGRVDAQLWVSSDRPDTDFAIRLTDVYLDGRSFILAQGIRRMRFRDSYATEVLMTPGAAYLVTVPLQNLALTLPAGHRLRIVIASADYPHFDRNRNDGGAMYEDGPLLVAANSVHHDAAHPSRLVLQMPSRYDIDGDGRLTVDDRAWLAHTIAANVTVPPTAGSGGDTDGDGRISAVDLLSLHRQIPESD
ncbi:MAG: CocE/NonD family hydrolase [Acidobacteria bacterium]|nr:CocE/NonD family hydrolase [Acidobacteriota bacterium]